MERSEEPPTKMAYTERWFWMKAFLDLDGKHLRSLKACWRVEEDARHAPCFCWVVEGVGAASPNTRWLHGLYCPKLHRNYTINNIVVAQLHARFDGSLEMRGMHE